MSPIILTQIKTKTDSNLKSKTKYFLKKRKIVLVDNVGFDI